MQTETFGLDSLDFMDRDRGCFPCKRLAPWHSEEVVSSFNRLKSLVCFLPLYSFRNSIYITTILSDQEMRQKLIYHMTLSKGTRYFMMQSKNTGMTHAILSEGVHYQLRVLLTFVVKCTRMMLAKGLVFCKIMGRGVGHKREAKGQSPIGQVLGGHAVQMSYEQSKSTYFFYLHQIRKSCLMKHGERDKVPFVPHPKTCRGNVPHQTKPMFPWIFMFHHIFGDPHGSLSYMFICGPFYIMSERAYR